MSFLSYFSIFLLLFPSRGPDKGGRNRRDAKGSSPRPRGPLVGPHGPDRDLKLFHLDVLRGISSAQKLRRVYFHLSTKCSSMKIMILVFLLLLTTLLTTARTTSTNICGSFFLPVAAISMFIRKEENKVAQRTQQRHDQEVEHNVPSIFTIGEHEDREVEQAVRVVLPQEEEQQEAEVTEAGPRALLHLVHSGAAGEITAEADTEAARPARDDDVETSTRTWELLLQRGPRPPREQVKILPLQLVAEEQQEINWSTEKSFLQATTERGTGIKINQHGNKTSKTPSPDNEDQDVNNISVNKYDMDMRKRIRNRMFAFFPHRGYDEPRLCYQGKKFYERQGPIWLLGYIEAEMSDTKKYQRYVAEKEREIRALSPPLLKLQDRINVDDKWNLFHVELEARIKAVQHNGLWWHQLYLERPASSSTDGGVDLPNQFPWQENDMLCRQVVDMNENYVRTLPGGAAPVSPTETGGGDNSAAAPYAFELSGPARNLRRQNLAEKAVDQNPWALFYVRTHCDKEQKSDAVAGETKSLAASPTSAVVNDVVVPRQEILGRDSSPSKKTFLPLWKLTNRAVRRDGQLLCEGFVLNPIIKHLMDLVEEIKSGQEHNLFEQQSRSTSTGEVKERKPVTSHEDDPTLELLQPMKTNSTRTEVVVAATNEDRTTTGGTSIIAQEHRSPAEQEFASVFAHLWDFLLLPGLTQYPFIFFCVPHGALFWLQRQVHEYNTLREGRRERQEIRQLHGEIIHRPGQDQEPISTADARGLGVQLHNSTTSGRRDDHAEDDVDTSTRTSTPVMSDNYYNKGVEAQKVEQVQQPPVVNKITTSTELSESISESLVAKNKNEQLRNFEDDIQLRMIVRASLQDPWIMLLMQELEQVDEPPAPSSHDIGTISGPHPDSTTTLQQPHAAVASLRGNEITGQTAGRRVFRQLSVLAAIYLARPDLMWIGNSEVLGPLEAYRGTELYRTSFDLAKQEMTDKRDYRAAKFAWFRGAHAKATAKAKAKAKAAAKAKAQASLTVLPRLTRKPDLLPRTKSFDDVYDRGLRESPPNPIMSSNLMPKNRLAAPSFLEEETSTTGTAAAAAEGADAEVEKNTTQQMEGVHVNLNNDSNVVFTSTTSGPRPGTRVLMQREPGDGYYRRKRVDAAEKLKKAWPLDRHSFLGGRDDYFVDLNGSEALPSTTFQVHLKKLILKEARAVRYKNYFYIRRILEVLVNKVLTLETQLRVDSVREFRQFFVRRRKSESQDALLRVTDAHLFQNEVWSAAMFDEESRNIRDADRAGVLHGTGNNNSTAAGGPGADVAVMSSFAQEHQGAVTTGPAATSGPAHLLPQQESTKVRAMKEFLNSLNRRDKIYAGPPYLAKLQERAKSAWQNKRKGTIGPKNIADFWYRTRIYRDTEACRVLSLVGNRFRGRGVSTPSDTTSVPLPRIYFPRKVGNETVKVTPPNGLYNLQQYLKQVLEEVVAMEADVGQAHYPDEVVTEEVEKFERKVLQYWQSAVFDLLGRGAETPNEDSLHVTPDARFSENKQMSKMRRSEDVASLVVQEKAVVGGPPPGGSAGGPVVVPGPVGGHHAKQMSKMRRSEDVASLGVQENNQKNTTASARKELRQDVELHGPAAARGGGGGTSSDTNDSGTISSFLEERKNRLSFFPQNREFMQQKIMRLAADQHQDQEDRGLDTVGDVDQAAFGSSSLEVDVHARQDLLPGDSGDVDADEQWSGDHSDADQDVEEQDEGSTTTFPDDVQDEDGWIPAEKPIRTETFVPTPTHWLVHDWHKQGHGKNTASVMLAGDYCRAMLREYYDVNSRRSGRKNNNPRTTSGGQVRDSQGNSNSAAGSLVVPQAEAAAVGVVSREGEEQTSTRPAALEVDVVDHPAPRRADEFRPQTTAATTGASAINSTSSTFMQQYRGIKRKPQESSFAQQQETPAASVKDSFHDQSGDADENHLLDFAKLYGESFLVPWQEYYREFWTKYYKQDLFLRDRGLRSDLHAGGGGAWNIDSFTEDEDHATISGDGLGFHSLARSGPHG
ncbi:unnamed protein product, partial [Amoebophrya sp. A120]|eukprot:GSA120T00013300001.1